MVAPRFEIDVSPELDALMARLDKFDWTASEELRKSVKEGMKLAGSVVKPLTPQGRGRLVKDFKSNVQELGKGQFKAIFTNKSKFYLRMAEGGRAPGKMPIYKKGDADNPYPYRLMSWIETKLGLSGSTAKQAAWGIARAIGRRGTKGKKMMQAGYEAVNEAAKRLFAEAGERIANRLGKK
jgi:hypothetical protein